MGGGNSKEEQREERIRNLEREAKREGARREELEREVRQDGARKEELEEVAKRESARRYELEREVKRLQAPPPKPPAPLGSSWRDIQWDAC